MIFPIGDTQVKGGHTPIVTYGLLAVNVGVFLWSINLGLDGFQAFLFEFGSIPGEITRGVDMHTLVTSMFLHGGWMHLIGNMIFLWVFADNIEAIVGSMLFLVFYIAGGLIGSAAHIFTDIHSMIPSVGASGAISAVLGAYLVMFPKSKIKVFILFFVTYMPAILFLLFWFAQQMLSGVGSLGTVSAETSGVAWWAHIGGFLFGVVSGFIFRSRVTAHNYARRENSGFV